MTISNRAVLQALLIAAPHHQGSHSDVGRQISSALETPFPVRMEDLRFSALSLGFIPENLWSWYRQLEKLNKDPQ